MRMVLVLFVPVAAAACLILFLVLRKSPEKAGAELVVPPHTASRPETPEAPAVIRGRGTVGPRVRLPIMPEVSGRAVYVHSQLHAGGVIRANERILQIDPAGYELAVRRARAAVDEAQARLELERAAAGLRRQSGQLPESEEQGDLPSILREPQMRQAEASLESARAELARAELDLSRTAVMLPFDVLIVEPTVSLGQYVVMGQPVAVACGTDAFEIEVPIRDEDLARLNTLGGVSLPGQETKAASVPAEVKAIFAGVAHTWQGRVVRTTGRVDPASGMISVVVEVPQPLDASAGRPPLLPGMAVEVLVPDAAEAGAPDTAENMGDF